MEQGRFGEFVTEVFLSEQRRKQEAADKESEDRLWSAYIHSYSDKSYIDWKAELIGRVNTTSAETGTYTLKRDADLTNDDVDNIINRLFNKG